MALRPVAWLGQKLLHSRWHPAYLRWTGQRDYVAEYRRFLSEAAERAAPVLDASVRVSVLMPVRNPNPQWLAEAIDSVRAQTYPNWELCLCDDASDAHWDAPADDRIRVARSPVRLGISGALNRARTLASGELLCFLDHDDLLVPRALQAIVQAGAGFVYSDEDYVDEAGRPVRPHLKPEWSPELLSNCMYVGHPMAVSAERFDAVGGFRGEYDGAQDYDLALRVTRSGASVAHVPEILYHWRQHARSIASDTGAKPYAHGAGRRAAQDAAPDAEVLEDRIPNQYRLRRVGADAARVSLVIPGIQLAQTGDLLVFLDPDLRPENRDWLDWMTAQLLRPEVGVVGAKVLAADGVVEHAREMVEAEMPFPGLRDPEFWKWLHFTRDVKAVNSSCFGVRREVYERLGRPDPAEVCTRARAAGLGVIVEANAVLRRVRFR